MTRRRHRYRATLAVLAALALPACASPPPPAPPVTVAAAPQPTQQNLTRVPMVSSGGTFSVDVAIAGVCCVPFILDTGASDVSVSPALFFAMRKGGHVTDADLIDVVKYQTASGHTIEGLRFRMPPMTVGGITVRNVIGSVSNGSDMLLLGQTFLRKFKFWAIDNANGVLVLGG
jgi:clan AA aspartic protease (TIGR02281 family)